MKRKVVSYLVSSLLFAGGYVLVIQGEQEKGLLAIILALAFYFLILPPVPPTKKQTL